MVLLVAVALGALSMSWHTRSECGRMEHDLTSLSHTCVRTYVIYVSTMCADLHSDVSTSVKCLGGDGCSAAHGNRALLKVVSETFEKTEASPISLQGVCVVIRIEYAWIR